jgi:hypothetical protein
MVNMSAEKTLRDKLHQYIDVADKQKLQALYILLENDIDWHLTSEEIKSLHQRRENHLKGLSKSYSVDESMKAVRKQKK